MIMILSILIMLMKITISLYDFNVGDMFVLLNLFRLCIRRRVCVKLHEFFQRVECLIMRTKSDSMYVENTLCP